ncbi:MULTISPECIES: cytochrome c [unclassified Alcanivorax]|jgi:mono/diheme cytochrome c family protein|uniref:c-type cytochrome n=1 Tax=unclassified Alcanivorax TaxID=2638842 RepID=UPI000789FA5E|nr:MULTISPECIES: cytochrome c [unclassified Alcanivorax]SEG27622.1 Cytochrome c553 [Alcanivorax sp. DSM 26293]
MAAPGFLSCTKCLVLALVFAIAAGGALIYSGLYPVGADDRHTPLTYWALETLRERSVDRASDEIEVPADLDTSDRLLAGGADYNDMCAGCHLKPGKAQSDFALGLNPQPPNLTQQHQDEEALESQARKRFWVIKHGIKASGMPAWGPNHDDERIWDMVAFLRRLPELSPEQYQILTTRGADDANHH